MGKQRGRLDPEEVKRALAEEAAAKAPPPLFHSPFAAARAALEKVVPPPKPGAGAGKASAAQRLARRAEERPREPSELAQLRARHRTERALLAEAVKPLRREGARRGPAVPGGGSDNGDDER